MDLTKVIGQAYIEMLEAKKKKLDDVKPSELEKDFDARSDKDLDNDGDSDSSDEYLHNRRKAVKKAKEDDNAKMTESSDIPTGIKIHHTDKAGKASHTIVFTANDAARHEKDVKKAGGKVTHRQLQYGKKEGPKVAVKESAEAVDMLIALDEAMKTDTKIRKAAEKMTRDMKKKGKSDTEIMKALAVNFPSLKESINWMMPKGKAAKDYTDKKVQQRKDMNKKNDPGAAKKHLALSVLDKEKAHAKAKKKGVKPSEFEYAVGHKPNRMTLIQKGMDPKKARSGKKLPEGVEMKGFAESIGFELKESLDILCVNEDQTIDVMIDGVIHKNITEADAKALKHKNKMANHDETQEKLDHERTEGEKKMTADSTGGETVDNPEKDRQAVPNMSQAPKRGNENRANEPMQSVAKTQGQ